MQELWYSKHTHGSHASAVRLQIQTRQQLTMRTLQRRRNTEWKNADNGGDNKFKHSGRTVWYEISIFCDDRYSLPAVLFIYLFSM